VHFEAIRRSHKLWILAVLCLAALTALTACGPSTPPGGGGEDEVGGPGTGGAVATRTRPEIHQLSPEQIAIYRAGVAEMQRRSSVNPDDPTGWIYQANIHGYPGDPNGDDPNGQICSITPGGPQPQWSTCQHGNFFFLAWHRMYLYYFERILRDASGSATFDLPFWDYENPNFRHLPEPFWNPADASNSLFVAQRAPGWNDGTRAFQPSTVSATAALATTPFCNCLSGSCAPCISGLPDDQAFGSRYTPVPVHSGSGFGAIESQPHNVVHTAIGGNVGWMSYVDCAARDPIFWLHHANIDRLWQVWLNQGGGRQNPISPSNPWTQTPYTFFDVGGAEVTLTACEILNMATQLDYVYEGVPVENVTLCASAVGAVAGEPAAPQEVEAPTTVAEAAQKDVSLGAASTRLKVTVPAEAAQRMAAAVPEGPTHYHLVIEGIRLVHPGAYYEVYVNLPEDQEPDTEGEYFVGTIAIFGHAHGADDEGATRTYDITGLVHSLQQKGEWTGDVNLTIVRGGEEFFKAAAVEEPAEYLKIRKVSVVEK